MKFDDAELENRRQVLVKLIESEGWKVLQEVWTPMLETFKGNLKAPDTLNRDWWAGQVQGVEKLLNWPQTNLKNVEKELTERYKKVA